MTKTTNTESDEVCANCNQPNSAHKTSCFQKGRGCWYFDADHIQRFCDRFTPKPKVETVVKIGVILCKRCEHPLSYHHEIAGIKSCEAFKCKCEGFTEYESGELVEITEHQFDEYKKIQEQLATLKAENAELKELENYVQHTSSCGLRKQMLAQCTCGLTQLLKGGMERAKRSQAQIWS